MRATKDTAKVKLDIQLGPVTPSQRQAWRRLWQKLMAEARRKIPPGFVAYSEAELWELFREGKPEPTQQTLRLIHEAKRHGGSIIDNEAMQ